MTLVFLLSGPIYLLIVWVFAALSLGELSASGRRGIGRRSLALTAALVWPLTLVGMVTVAAARAIHSGRVDGTRPSAPADRSAPG